MEPIENPGVSCQRQQRRKMPVAQPKWRQFSVEVGGLLEIVFFAIKVTFVSSQFPTDFDSQNRCLCSRRSHGPLLRAFCLCFHFKVSVLTVESGLSFSRQASNTHVNQDVRKKGFVAPAMSVEFITYFLGELLTLWQVESACFPGDYRPVHPPNSSVFATDLKAEYGNTDSSASLRIRV